MPELFVCCHISACNSGWFRADDILGRQSSVCDKTGLNVIKSLMMPSVSMAFVIRRQLDVRIIVTRSSEGTEYVFLCWIIACILMNTLWSKIKKRAFFRFECRENEWKNVHYWNKYPQMRPLNYTRDRTIRKTVKGFHCQRITHFRLSVLMCTLRADVGHVGGIRSERVRKTHAPTAYINWSDYAIIVAPTLRRLAT